MPYKDPEKRRACWARHQATHREAASARQVRYMHRRRNHLAGLRAAGCVDCGAAAVDFHHRDPSTKLFNIGDGTSRAWQKLLAELAKCDPVCESCHTERHRQLAAVG